MHSRIFRGNLRTNSLLKVGEYTQNKKIIFQNICLSLNEKILYMPKTCRNFLPIPN